MHATLPHRPALGPGHGPPLAAWMRWLGRAVNGPGLLLLPVSVASVAQALATRGAAPFDAALVVASALLAWVPVAACAQAAPLLRDRAMQWRRVALLVALVAGGALVAPDLFAGFDAMAPADGPAGLASALVLQSFVGGLVVGVGGCWRRRAHRAAIRRGSQGRRA